MRLPKEKRIVKEALPEYSSELSNVSYCFGMNATLVLAVSVVVGLPEIEQPKPEKRHASPQRDHKMTKY